MASFHDTQGREWTISLDALVIEKVREDCDPQFLLHDGEHNTPNRLANDPVLFCHVVYLLCERQRNERNVSLDEFYREVLGDGDTIEAAGDALGAAIINFTRPQMRGFQNAIAKKEQEVQRLAIERVMARIDDPVLMETILARVDEELDKALTRRLSATGSPDSAESVRPD